MKAIVLIVLVTLAFCAYDRNKAKQYADTYWNTANHQCGSYLRCTPWAYFGNEVCGYEVSLFILKYMSESWRRLC